MQNQKTVYQKTIHRFQTLFKEFDQIYISFSGGKDSGVLLNLYMECMKLYAPEKRAIIFHLDYEVCYKKTEEYVYRTLQEYKNIADIYHICVPFKVTTCTSMFQSYWRPWDDEKKTVGSGNVQSGVIPKMILSSIVKICGIMNFKLVLRTGFIKRIMQSGRVVLSE